MDNTLQLLTPIQLGTYTLPNRLVMAPLTRCRAAAGNVPYELHATYYAQRATAGLIISEATQVCPQGQGYPATPGIHSAEQIAGWKKVTQAVHDKGGRIFLQLWHVGRISHPDFQPNGELPVAPSAIAPTGEVGTYEGMKPYLVPRALELEEIPSVIDQYRQGAKNALEAGFDGIEVHGANGYLIDQFLQDCTNHRTDAYGGSVENRSRFLMEVLEAVIEVWGGNRVGLRLSPSGSFNDMGDSDPKTLFSYVVQELNKFNLAYLHLIEPRLDASQDTLEHLSSDLTAGFFRSLFNSKIIAAGGLNREIGEQIISKGEADLIAYGRIYISNPDLVKRFALNASLNPYDRSTFYGGTEQGYTDYPFLEEA